MLGMGLPGHVALLDFLPRDLARRVLLLPFADASFHPLGGAVPQLLDDLPRLGQVHMKSAEVDAVSQGKDVRLLVQLQPQPGKPFPGQPQGLPGCLHVGADHVPIVVVHAGQGQAQLLVDEVHDAVGEVHRKDVAALVSQGQPLHLVDVRPHEPLHPLVREAIGQRPLQPLVVDALEEVPHVPLDDRAVCVVPLLHGPVGETGGLACRLVRPLPPQEVGPHVLRQVLDALVRPLAPLGGVGVPGQTWAQFRVDHKVVFRPLYHLVPEAGCLNEPLFRLIDQERVQRVRRVVPLRKRFGGDQQLLNCAIFKSCRALLAPLVLPGPQERGP